MFKKILSFNLLILIIISCNNINSNNENNKYVIGTNKPWGLFAAFFCVLDHLVYCEKNSKIPVVYWSSDSPYYSSKGFNNSYNVWEYYFEPVSKLKYKYLDKINRNYLTDHPCKQIEMLAYKVHNKIKDQFIERFNIKKVINKYIQIKSNIRSKINNFYEKSIKGKKTIGIHLRGTDKSKEFKYSSAKVLLDEANKYKNYQYFVATDEQALLDLAKKELNGKVVFYNSFRSSNHLPVHYHNFNSAKVGEDVLIEVMLLSKCEKFIHTDSNVSMAVLCFNPKLQSIPL